MREKESYRDILESLLTHFNKHWVYPTELAGYLGMDYRTAQKKFDISRKGISIEELARRMCQ